MKVNTPEQAHAIRNLMACLRRAQKHDGREAWMFPEFKPGKTSTLAYVNVFEAMLCSRSIIGPRIVPRNIRGPAPFYPPGVPEVVDESNQLALCEA